MATVSFTRTIVINNRSAAKKIKKSLKTVSDYSSEAVRKVSTKKEVAPEVISNILDRFCD